MNIDEAVRATPGPAGGGCIYRDHTTTFVGGFSIPLREQIALAAELLSCMKVVSIAKDRN